MRNLQARKIENVCVFCGSTGGNNPAFVKDARAFGKIIAVNRIGLVYGGGDVGLMGELAHSVLDNSGHVKGFIPKFLIEREKALRHERCDETVVKDLHVRKQRMSDESDAFVSLAGGIGSLEELSEQLTWRQLGRHDKPSLVVNTLGFWDPFIDLLGLMDRYAFINYPGKEVKLLVAKNVEDVLPLLRGEKRGQSASLSKGNGHDLHLSSAGATANL